VLLLTLEIFVGVLVKLLFAFPFCCKGCCWLILEDIEIEISLGGGAVARSGCSFLK